LFRNILLMPVRCIQNLLNLSTNQGFLLLHWVCSGRSLRRTSARLGLLGGGKTGLDPSSRLGPLSSLLHRLEPP
jgi:hypothetical protein